MLTVNSLFAGIGGFDEGFRRAGMKTLAQVEINPIARNILARHFPEADRSVTNVKEAGKHNLPSADVFCGGFPCQDVSVAGRRAGLAGERSGLWFEFHRLLDECRPRWVVIENVAGLLSSNEGRDFATILHGLVELGYGVCWRILDAQYFGVAQRRRRVFIVGHLGDGRAAEVLFEREGSAWDPPARGATGQDATADAGTSFKKRGGYGWSASEGATGTLESHASGGNDAVPLVAGTLQASGAGSARTGNSRSEADMLITESFRMRGFGDYEADDKSSALKKRDGKDATDLVVWGLSGELNASPELVGALDAGSKSGTGHPAMVATFDERNITSKANRTRVEDGLPAQTLHPGGLSVIQSHDRIDRWADESDRIRAIQSDAKASTAQEHVYIKSTGITDSLTKTRPPQTINADSVRRLTPIECSRLQGFPDDWTAVQPDGPRYEQLGNAVCVNVAEWLGRRIVAVDLKYAGIDP